MKLVDIFVIVDGHALGPFLTTIPQDHRGDDVEIDEGGDCHVIITPRASGSQTRARGTLQRT